MGKHRKVKASDRIRHRHRGNRVLHKDRHCKVKVRAVDKDKTINPKTVVAGSAAVVAGEAVTSKMVIEIKVLKIRILKRFNHPSMELLELMGLMELRLGLSILY
jgi:hypothetical protein